MLLQKPFFMAGQPTPPYRTPPRNKALLRAYKPLVSLNKALLSHDFGGDVYSCSFFSRRSLVIGSKLDFDIHSAWDFAFFWGGGSRWNA